MREQAFPSLYEVTSTELAPGRVSGLGVVVRRDPKPKASFGFAKNSFGFSPGCFNRLPGGIKNERVSKM